MICAFGSMLFCFLCDKNFQKVTNYSALVPEISSEERDLWSFGILHVALMQWNELSGISVWVI